MYRYRGTAKLEISNWISVRIVLNIDRITTNTPVVPALTLSTPSTFVSFDRHSYSLEITDPATLGSLTSNHAFPKFSPLTIPFQYSTAFSNPFLPSSLNFPK